MLKKATRPITERGKAAARARPSPRPRPDTSNDVDQDASPPRRRPPPRPVSEPPTRKQASGKSGSKSKTPTRSNANSSAEASRSPNSDGGYEVGYGKPPKATQFRKGKSGNPNGRPKRSRNTSTLVKEALDEIVTVSINGISRRLTKREVVSQRVVEKAMKGDLNALKQILMLEGTSFTTGNLDETDVADDALDDEYAEMILKWHEGTIRQSERDLYDIDEDNYEPINEDEVEVATHG